MRLKLLFVTGTIAGYILGARAGRMKYEKIKSKATEAWENPRVQKVVAETQDFVKENAPVVADKLAEGARIASEKFAETATIAGTSVSEGSKVAVAGAKDAADKVAATAKEMSEKVAEAARSVAARVSGSSETPEDDDLDAAPGDRRH